MDKELFDNFKYKLIDKAEEDGKLLRWNPIDYSTISWLEFKDKDGFINYLGKNDTPYQLVIGTSIEDLRNEYGDDNFPAGAIKDGRLIEFEGNTELDDYVRNTYGLKSEKDIEKEVNTFFHTPVEDMEMNLSSIEKETFIKAARAAGYRCIEDFVGKSPEGLGNVFGEKSAAAVIGAINKIGADYGKDFIESYYKKSKEQYVSALKNFLGDNVIDPYELCQLEQLQEKLGLSDSDVKNITTSYIDTRYQNTTIKPVVAKRLNIDDAHDFAKCFNDNKEEIEENQAKGNPVEGILPKPTPYYLEMTDEVATTILETLDIDGGWNIYADFAHNKFWREDKYDEEIEDVSLLHLARMAADLANSWDNKTLSASERKQIDNLDIFLIPDILVPVDVKYKFTIPREIVSADSAQECLDVIKNLFNTPSEVVDLNLESNDKGLSTYFEIRHNFVCSKNTDYNNINFKNIDDGLQQIVGKKLNEHFGTDQKILFSDLSSYIPEKFYDERNNLIAIINNDTISEFAQSPEEYSRSLDLEILREAGSSVWKETERFMQKKNQFLSVLEKNPLLKSYVQDKWIKRLKEKEIERQKSEENQKTAVENFFEKVNEACKDDKSLGNVILQASKVIRSMPKTKKELVDAGLIDLGLTNKDKLQKYFTEKAAPKKERKIERKRDLDYERGR